MTYKFSNLEAACGGSINPDTLRRFQVAMREYEMFMDSLGAMLAPRQEQRDAKR
jgi:hypothetical protein